MDVFDLYAKISLDTSGYEKNLSGAKSMFVSAGKSISASTVAMGTMIAHGLERAASAVINLGKSAIEASSDIAAQNAQFKQTFGELEAAATGVFSQIEQDTGILSRRLQTAGTRAFAQFKGAGLDAASALSETDKYTRLAADAAAYFDLTLEETDERLRSFLRGNTEAGDTINLFTSEMQRNEKAMELYGKKWLELTEAQRQMLMLDVVNETYERIGVIGQAARETDQWTNVVGNLNSAWETFTAVIGTPFREGLTPVIQKLTEFFSDETVQMRVGIFAANVGKVAGLAFEGVIGFLDKLLALSTGEETLKFDIQIPTWDEIKSGALEKLNGIISGIQAAATWTLGAFTIEGVSAQEILDDFGAWWTSNTMYDKIAQLAKWALGKINVPDSDADVVGAFSTFWENIAAPGIQAAAKWALGEMVLPALVGENGVVTAFANWWNNEVAPDVFEKTGWNVRLPELPSVDEMLQSIADWWSSVKAAVGNMLSLSASVNVFSKPGSTSTPAGQGVSAGGAVWGDYNSDINDLLDKYSPGYATGLNYVPYNGFRATLHAGETVLNRADATAWRAGNQAQQVDYATMGAVVGEAVRAALEGMNVNIDGQRAGSLLAEPVSRSIAQMARNRRYQMG